jgi:hypothetical protein
MRSVVSCFLVVFIIVPLLATVWARQFQPSPPPPPRAPSVTVLPVDPADDDSIEYEVHGLPQQAMRNGHIYLVVEQDSLTLVRRSSRKNIAAVATISLGKMAGERFHREPIPLEREK